MPRAWSAPIKAMIVQALPIATARIAPHAAGLVELALTVVLGITLADLVWTLVPVPATAASAQTAVAQVDAGQQPRGPSRAVSTALRELFGNAVDAQAVTGAVRETRLNLTLRGILADRDSPRKLALIAVGDTGERVYAAGDAVAGAELVRIESRRVVLRRDGVFESLSLPVEGWVAGGTTLETQRSGSPRASGDGSRAGGEPLVAGGTLPQRLANLPDLLRQAEAEPYWQDGRPAGFRLVRLDDASIFRELGFEPGDVIRSVNDVAIHDTGAAMQAYQDLRAAETLRIDILRGDRELTINYNGR